MIETLRSIALPSLALTLLYALSSVPAHALNPAVFDKLLAADGAPGDAFGNNVAIDGDTALITENSIDNDRNSRGSAYIFTRVDGAWIQQQKLVPADDMAISHFARSVALDGDTALIGSVQSDSKGSAHVFMRTNGVWTQQQTILPEDGAENDYFGRSVSLDGNTALIGARYDDDNGYRSGSAYVFTRTSGVWAQQQKLLPEDGAENDYFGESVSLDGDTALIGALYDDNNYIDFSGSAYLFTRTEGVWTQQQKLVPTDGPALNYFGNSVALDGNTAIIGAYYDDDNGYRTGSAYVFTSTGGDWTQRQKLVTSDGVVDGFFSASIALDGNIALFGTFERSTYVFTRSGDVWSEKRKLVSPQGEDFFGISITLDGDFALIGAYADDENGPLSGAAYIFDLASDTGVDVDEDSFSYFDDNCPAQFNPLQEDFDDDLIGDACDTDDDDDNLLDEDDNCPLTVNVDQADFDDDGTGDVCDEDDDNDGLLDIHDLAPLDPDSGAGNEVTVSRSVLSSADDVEQRSGGRIAFDSNDLELVDDNGFNQTIGLRFAELAIPQGAIILEARVLFWVDEQNEQSTSLTLRGVDSDDAGPWSSSLYDVSTRPQTNASINWSPAAWTERGTASVDQTQSPDLATIVREIVNRPGWQADNALSLVIEGGGRRVAYSYDQLSGQKAPMLTVRYATVEGNAAPTVELGSDLEVLQSDILTLKGQVQDDGLPVPPGATSVEWRALSGPGTVHFDDPSSATSAMTFASTGRYELELRAFDGALVGLDRIIINVIGEIGKQVVERRISSSDDDAEEALTSAGEPGLIDLDSSDLELVVESTPQLVGLRFTDMAIPSGATITDAWVQFTVDETRSSSTNDLTLQGESVADAVSFEAEAGNLSSRSRTAASVNWSPPAWERIDDVGDAQRTPDLSAIVQEIVDDANGWQSGNALVVLIDGSGQRIAESFDGERNSAPLLHVEYK